MYKINLKNKAEKGLIKIEKGDKKSALKIRTFLRELEKIENPFALKNCGKMEGYENRWKWYVGIHYRVIGEKHDDILTIEVIEITTRENAYR